VEDLKLRAFDVTETKDLANVPNAGKLPARQILFNRLQAHQ
jgi:hypothetical protein